ncbi:MAG: winged helix-turn-helix transcriptional regulator [Candidatus Omnitrophica bacterium]|nr:winged helix-turn-helix transcriptional regulator [Candidatus Omnitrophota bacterium]
MDQSQHTHSNDAYMDRDEQMILNLLSAIEENPNTTQKDLATRLGVAVGVVNSYLKRVIYKGYVKTKSLQRRRLRYLLTPSGIKEKTRLTYEFLQYSYVYIREIRRKTRALLEPYAAQGKRRVIFYGAGEAAELAYLAVRELGMHLEAIVDEDHVNERCIDHVIQDLSWIHNNGSADVLLVIKSVDEKEELSARIQTITEKNQIELISLK